MCRGKVALALAAFQRVAMVAQTPSDLSDSISSQRTSSAACARRESSRNVAVSGVSAARSIASRSTLALWGAALAVAVRFAGVLRQRRAGLRNEAIT